MFEIEYKGANCVVIGTKKVKIIADPKLSIVGLKDVLLKDSVELVTEHRFATNNPDSRLLVDGPGEYGVAEFDIVGIPARRHIDTENEGLLSTIYRLEVGETRVGVIGNIADKLSDEQLEQLGVLDILVIPVGGNGYTLDAVSASNIVKLISPKFVIPVHYADKQLNYEVPQGELDLFISELGAPVEETTKYKSKQLLASQVPLTILKINRS
ncbi:MAG TPA: MBL fold metallo-hydrolase [Candidatus Saccharimonadales bacterium]|nr:MBL fold metallo-hydrolase [Candidatus Saccharimonadales bacterium]